MISLQTLLATDILRKVPLFVLIAFGVALVVAFIIGAVKAGGKVSKGGICWAVASLAFVFGYKLLGKKNPLTSALKNTKLADLSGFIWALILVLVSVALAMLVYWLLKIIFRNRETWVKNYEMDENGLEYEMDDVDDMPKNELPKNKELIVEGKGRPCVLSRICGGLFAALNVATILSVITAVIVLFIECTYLKDLQIGTLVNVKIGRLAVKFAATYVLDVLSIGLILFLAYKGYKTGFIRTISGALMTVGVVAMVIFGFATPFVKPLASMHFFKVLISRCSLLFGKMPSFFGSLCGKLFAGLLIAAFTAVLSWFIGWAFSKLADVIEDHKVVRIIDGVFATILYIGFGTAICMAVWGVAYIFDYSGVIGFGSMFNENASFAQQCFKAAEALLKNFAEKFLLKYKA